MVSRNNPFALVRAADYTDVQINSLWVELGSSVINAVIEPTSSISKYILGGRGSGKTHLLRYHSYPAVRLRFPKMAGLDVVVENGYLAIFLRATALDAARFEDAFEASGKWQQLFGVYLEMKLAEGVLEALCDIKSTSPDEEFDDKSFLREICSVIIDESVGGISSVDELRKWFSTERRQIDDAINNSAFSGSLNVRILFSVGSLCLSIKRAISAWAPRMQNVPLLYLIDEIENFSPLQQQVINSFIRYGEGQATFRVTGRLYGVKTLETIGGGEENREGAEFKRVNLDDLLKTYPKYGVFARKFVMKRLGMEYSPLIDERDPSCFFEEVSSDEFYAKTLSLVGYELDEDSGVRLFSEAMRSSGRREFSEFNVKEILSILISEFPSLLARLNILLFCKKYTDRKGGVELSSEIRGAAIEYIQEKSVKGFYANALGHYKSDLFAQLCRESNKTGGVPYAGFDTFVQMSSGNPRNLLIILSRAYEIASFRDIDFINSEPLSVTLQTAAAVEAARFLFERDSNYGGLSDQAKNSVERLATLLRTARYSLNIPEVSPLAVSFNDESLTNKARETLAAALNFSLLFESKGGRPDRNSHRVNRKVQLNPLLSPRWGLPIGKRGDLSLSTEMALAIFDPDCSREFDAVLKSLHQKWNSPFSSSKGLAEQGSLF
ncbi:hypothetical protein ACP4J5_16325 [Pseudomonas oryzihabitans]|uniref:ORC-CDC6 family AAA ATPase n=1 Tax=Pseudomonas oryzihabitans TaxID=47885 RepID=UPI003CE6DC12